MTENAKSFLARAQGQVVVVQFRDRQVRGKLAGADEFINLHLEEVEEITEKGTRKLGQVVVRGSQVIAIHATKLGPPVAEERSERVWSGNSAERTGYSTSRDRFGSRERYSR